MELKIIDKKDNPLFNRKEIEASISAEVTPDKQTVKKLISEKLSTIPEAIKLKGIHGKFGSKNFTVKANVYDSIEDKEKIEPKSKKEVEAEKKAAEQASAEKTSAPEEKVEETPQEEKKIEEQTQEKEMEVEVSDNKSKEGNEQKDSELKSEENTGESETKTE